MREMIDVCLKNFIEVVMLVKVDGCKQGILNEELDSMLERKLIVSVTGGR